MQLSASFLEEKKQRLAAQRPQGVDFLMNLTEWFSIELTYTSNAIEGNTLSRAETALVVEEGMTVGGKTLREHLEAVNHAQAFTWVVGQVRQVKKLVTERDILDLHQLILQKNDDVHAGRYRTVPVRIAGAAVIMPNAVKVPKLMSEFMEWLTKSATTEHPITTALEAHLKFVSIHPFVDGNGRTARLLMNWLLMSAGYPPAIIRKEDRKTYLSAIEKVQLGGSTNDYLKCMYEAVDRSLEVCFAALNSGVRAHSLRDQELLKIGQLAELTEESTPTLRYWTKEGLLQVREYSPGGYQLYDQDTAETVHKIRKLQKSKRLTLAEIRSAL